MVGKLIDHSDLSLGKRRRLWPRSIRKPAIAERRRIDHRRFTRHQFRHQPPGAGSNAEAWPVNPVAMKNPGSAVDAGDHRNRRPA